VVDIIIKGGPCDGETDRVPDYCVIYRRSAKGPSARYKNSGTHDPSGRCIFEHVPPRPGQPELMEGVYDAKRTD